MLIRVALFTLICIVSTPNYAFEDHDARVAILQLRVQIKELKDQIQEIETKSESKIKNLNARLDSIESDNKKLKAENEKIRSDLDERRLARENPGYQELRDEINAIYRLLLQVIPK